MSVKVKTYLWKIVKTMAETAAGMLTVGVAINEIAWLHVLAVSAASGIYTALVNVNDLKPDGAEVES